MRPSRLLRRLVPRSLATRLILMTLATILLVQAASVISVSYYQRKFMREVAAEFTLTTIRTLRAALAEIPADDRADFVHAASKGQWRLWSRSLPSEARLQERRPPHRHRAPATANDIRDDLRFFVDVLNERLDDGARVALSRGPVPRVYISLLPTPGPDHRITQREWLVIPLDQIAPPVATPLIVAWLGGLGVLLLLAAAFSWHITRPLTRLAKAADQLALGQPQRVLPSGPLETHKLAERFNAMLDALAESSAVRQTLLAGLPHDLKGPLSRMWLRVEMAEDPRFTEGMRKDIREMQGMVDQFIGFVRGTDPGTYRYASLNLLPWLEEQVDAWESAGSEVFLVSRPGRPIMLKADAAALARLLDNLIGNALNHGKPPVEIGLERRGDRAVIRVSDHGTGIAADRRAEALRPFSRLDDARTRTGSVGLGLALSEAIAKAHGGDLTLGATARGGLMVSVSLPFERPLDTP